MEIDWSHILIQSCKLQEADTGLETVKGWIFKIWNWSELQKLIYEASLILDVPNKASSRILSLWYMFELLTQYF